MKRILSLTLALLMILACTPIVIAESEFEYVDYEGGIAITGYNGEGGVVTIPAEIDGKKVIATKSTMNSDVVNALGGRNDITKIILPEGLKLIGYDSFYKMTNLKEVVLPNTLERIAEGAFAGSGITSIDIPESVTMINSGAFNNTKLTSIYIPKNTNLGGSVVAYCKSLTKITVDSANPYYAADGKYLYSKNNGTAVNYAGGLANKRIVIPSYILNIMHYCFNSNDHIETVITHKNFQKIYSMAFWGCDNLKEVYVTGKNSLVSNSITDNPNLIVYTNGKICDFADGERDTCDDFIVKPYIEGMENPNTPTITEKAKETTTKPISTTKPSVSKPEKETVDDSTTKKVDADATETTLTTDISGSTTLKETEANTVVNSENAETTGNDKNNATPVIIGVVAVAVAGAVAIGVTVTMKKKKK